MKAAAAKPAEQEVDDKTAAAPRTLGDVYLENLKIVIQCRDCGHYEAHYPQDLPGFPDQPVDALVRRRICGCGSKNFEVRQVINCDGLVKKG